MIHRGFSNTCLIFGVLTTIGEILRLPSQGLSAVFFNTAENWGGGASISQRHGS